MPDREEDLFPVPGREEEIVHSPRYIEKRNLFTALGREEELMHSPR